MAARKHSIRFTVEKGSEQARFCEGLRYAGFGIVGSPKFMDGTNPYTSMYFFLFAPKGQNNEAWVEQSISHFASLGFTVKHVVDP